VLIAFNKPFGVICKFSPEPGKQTLADFIRVKNVYPAGRLIPTAEGPAAAHRRRRAAGAHLEPEVQAREGLLGAGGR
jgi:hypothetical protein